MHFKFVALVIHNCDVQDRTTNLLISKLRFKPLIPCKKNSAVCGMYVCVVCIHATYYTVYVCLGMYSDSALLDAKLSNHIL